MAVQLYLSMIPESLVASMLGPEEFGSYLATGTPKRPHGPAMFFQLKPDFHSDYFDLSHVDERCVPHSDGQPKHSVYLAIYRVMEHVPLDAIDKLWLATAHGRVLGLEQGKAPPEPSSRYHLYQELCPVHPLIASLLDPGQFCRLITDLSRPICVPRLCFVELALLDLADDPSGGDTGDLPYHNVDHIRNCLMELHQSTVKQSKTVDRISHHALLYRCVRTGFFVGDQERMIYYPYPSQEELAGKYYQWWRCANDSEVQDTL